MNLEEQKFIEWQKVNKDVPWIDSEVVEEAMCKSKHWPIDSKSKFVRLYQLGEFGNHSPTWDTPMEFAEANYRQGLVHLRNRTAGRETFYNLDPLVALCQWAGMDNPLQFYCSAMAPHEHNLLQGEVWDGPWGLNLHGTYEIGPPMRDALSVSPFDCTGLEAKLSLRRVMNDKSWEWFQYLLEAYPEHVIEFSAFNCCWGTRPAENVVWWEVRKY